MRLGGLSEREKKGLPLPVTENKVAFMKDFDESLKARWFG